MSGLQAFIPIYQINSFLNYANNFKINTNIKLFMFAIQTHVKQQ